MVGLDVDKKCVINLLINAKLNRLDNLIDVLQSNSLNCFRERSFDFIISNPPYLPCSLKLDKDICAGLNCELLLKLIQESLTVSRLGVLMTCSLYSTPFLNFVFNHSRILHKLNLIIDEIIIFMLTKHEFRNC